SMAYEGLAAHVYGQEGSTRYATRKRHSPDQIVRKLTAADRLLAEGRDTAAVCRELGVSEATYHRWRNQFGGLKAEDAKRLKDLVTLPSTPTDQSEQRRTVTNAYSHVAGMHEQVRTQACAV